jgi:hypothetical protein
MPIPEDLRTLLQERRANEEREARIERRRALLGTLLRLALSVGAGMGLIGMSLHSGDEEIGKIWWWSGWLVWVGGVLATLLRAYRQAEQRGD